MSAPDKLSEQQLREISESVLLQVAANGRAKSAGIRRRKGKLASSTLNQSTAIQKNGLLRRVNRLLGSTNTQLVRIHQSVEITKEVAGDIFQQALTNILAKK